MNNIQDFSFEGSACTADAEACSDNVNNDILHSLVPNWITCLEEELDRKLLVVLRDGRKLIGILRTFDQFGNLMLEHCFQRIIVDAYFADLELGCLIIRGENIILFGAVDDSKSTILQEKPFWEILTMQDAQEKADSQRRRERSNFGDRYCGFDFFED